MPSRVVEIASAIGLHARPTALFVQAVNGYQLPVSIARVGGDAVNAASILLVMGLGVKHGESVELSAEGDNAEEVLDALVELLSRDLDA